MKLRKGGVLTPEYEQRALDGDVMALRALVTQAQGIATVDLARKDWTLQSKPDGTGGERLTFTGYASVVDAPFTMTDWLGDYQLTLHAGAFKKTLSLNPDVIFCLNHDWDAVPMARTKPGTLRLSDDSTGLHNEADLDPTRSDVHAVRSAMDAGELDAQSFAFHVTQQEWSDEGDERHIYQVDIDGGDTSVVTYPANPWTTGSIGLHQRQAHSLLRTNVPALIVQRARMERQAGKSLSAATMATLQSVHELISASHDGTNEAIPLLSQLMGIDEQESAPDHQIAREALRRAELLYRNTAA